MPSLAFNKRARYDFDLIEKYEGGLKLTGPEVKAAKLGHMQMQGAFLHVRAGELWLKNAFIGKYAPAGAQESYDPTRTRKVLVKRGEITRLIGRTQADGLTLVPISVYTRGNLIKLEFALARGKRQYEKRETIKKRDVQRQIQERMRE